MIQQTSKDAYHDPTVKVGIASIRQQITTFMMVNPDLGYTAEEVADRIALSHNLNSVKSRLSEMLKDGEVIVSGWKKTKSGLKHQKYQWKGFQEKQSIPTWEQAFKKVCRQELTPLEAQIVIEKAERLRGVK